MDPKVTSEKAHQKLSDERLIRLVLLKRAGHNNVYDDHLQAHLKLHLPAGLIVVGTAKHLNTILLH